MYKLNISKVVSLMVLFICSCENEHHDINDLKTFHLSSPLNNTINSDTNLYLQWDQINNTALNLPYTGLSLQNKSPFEFYLWEKELNSLVKYETTHDNSLMVYGLKYSTSYKWKVIAHAGNEYTKETEVWEFTTEPKTYIHDIKFSTQSELANFGKQNYERVDGDIEIRNSEDNPIIDLTPLSSIKHIEGSIRIYGNKSLTSVSGFTNLLTLGGVLSLRFNESLTSIKGFNKLKSIGIGIYIVSNTNITDIDAFHDLKELTSGSLEISGNRSIVNLSAFKNLEIIGDGIYINSNESLSQIDGFDNLSFIGKSLEIVSNEKLFSIPEFISLKSINGDFALFGNERLRNLNGFKNLDYVGGRMDLRSNLKIFPLFENLDSIGGTLNLCCTDFITEINGFNSLIEIGGYLKISSNENLKSINGFNNLEKVKDDIDLSRNRELEDIKGFQNLISVGGTFYIQGSNLYSFKGSDKLEYIGENLEISWNYNLESIEGFRNLNYIGLDLNVIVNSNLTEFCGLQNIIESGGLNGKFNVRANLNDPTKEEILLLECN